MFLKIISNVINFGTPNSVDPWIPPPASSSHSSRARPLVQLHAQLSPLWSTLLRPPFPLPCSSVFQCTPEPLRAEYIESFKTVYLWLGHSAKNPRETKIIYDQGYSMCYFRCQRLYVCVFWNNVRLLEKLKLQEWYKELSYTLHPDSTHVHFLLHLFYPSLSPPLPPTHTCARNFGSKL